MENSFTNTKQHANNLHDCSHTHSSLSHSSNDQVSTTKILNSFFKHETSARILCGFGCVSLCVHFVANNWQQSRTQRQSEPRPHKIALNVMSFELSNSNKPLETTENHRRQCGIRKIYSFFVCFFSLIDTAEKARPEKWCGNMIVTGNIQVVCLQEFTFSFLFWQNEFKRKN